MPSLEEEYLVDKPMWSLEEEYLFVEQPHVPPQDDQSPTG